ncbi:hypothetical protein GCM10027290_46540 [Micromonospora sonneratiae]|uniref:DUF998 domain-containing protein n=1 Tax=Micromonospora sonneratiae TaxID=1184706 RepID=A0ABW3YC76_9ACTN
MSGTIDRASEPTRHPLPQTHRRSATDNGLLICGVLSPLVYAVTTIVASARWEGYSSTAQTISELFAIDAPARPLVVPLLLAHGVLLIAFAFGVWRTASGKRTLRTTAGLLIANGVVGLVAPVFFPIHLRGVEPTLTDTMHAVVTGLIVVLILLAVGFAAGAFGRIFRFYSLVTLVALLGFGALAGLDGPELAANEPTPWLGVFERINIGGYLLWLLVLAVALLRRPTQNPPGQPASAHVGPTGPTSAHPGKGSQISPGKSRLSTRPTSQM